jgi:hypothetical protein
MTSKRKLTLVSDIKETRRFFNGKLHRHIYRWNNRRDKRVFQKNREKIIFIHLSFCSKKKPHVIPPTQIIGYSFQGQKQRPVIQPDLLHRILPRQNLYKKRNLPQ